MKLIKCVVPSLTAYLMFLSPEATAATWSTDLPAAQAKAKTENKMVLINFTASDRCKWCIKLAEEVFSKPEFDKFASNNLVLVEVDFRASQTAALLKANQTLAQNFQVQGYPTLIVLNSQGKKTATLGYMEGGPASFIAALGGRSPGGNSAPSVARSKGAPEQTASAKPAPRPESAATPTPAALAELTLKGISGPKENRLAMINNRTLAAGESTTIRLRDRAVKIHCVEVLEKSVIVTVDDSEEQREIRLRGP